VTLRRDPVSGRLVAIAPGRARRPGAGHALIEPPTQDELDECPFCRGREDRTPPERLRLPKRADDWVIRVVPNLYPALERQEVIVHSPEHKRLFTELTDGELGYVAYVVERSEGFWLVNEGRLAGSSLPHAHSQLVYSDDPLPAVAAESPAGVLEVLAHDELVVAEQDGLRAVAHPVGRLPYELLIAADEIGPALLLLRECITRMQAVEGLVPWNAWLHRGRHPHIEVVPRITVMAGLELGAGIYVNSLDPSEAADRLRGAGAS
jgi:UDPglucose--hexose-1-phosphate uridylyltransferase